MRQFSSLNDLIRPEIPGAPDFIIERNTLIVVRDFCAKTHIWKQEVTVTASSGDEETDFILDDYGEVHAVVSMECDDYPIEDITFVPPDTLQFADALEDDISIDLIVATKPTLSDVSAPEWLMDKYEQYLVSGVLARMMAQILQPWTSVEMAAYHAARFRAGIAVAVADRGRGHKVGPLSVTRIHTGWI